MKLKHLISNKFIKISTVKYLFRVMKITLIFLFVLSFQLFASSSKAQDAIVKLQSNEVTVKQLISEIENQTDYLVVYSNSEVSTTRKVNFKNKSDKVSKYLIQAFEGTDIGHDFENNYIILKRNALDNKTSEKVSSKSFQQTGKIITGTVLDTKNEPVIGANIIEEGTTNGTITDTNGRFSLNVKNNATIHVSYIGYLEEKINTVGKNLFDIVLQEDTKGLDELVVIGYGSMRKRDLTGTVSTISSEKLQGTPAVNFAEAIAGKVAGVQIQQTNGVPGGKNFMFRIRGGNSITAGNAPLYVLDGYPLESGNLNMLNPNDIQSIEILKDASASAIYGSRGGNGVVLITTKNGKGRQGTNIELNIHTGIQQVANRPEMLDTYEYCQWFIDAHNNAWVQADPIKNKITDPSSVRGGNKNYVIPDEFYHPESLPNTNWGDVIFRNAITQNYQLNVSNNNEKGYSLIGGSYVNQQGTVIGTDYQKFNLHSNFYSKVSDKISIGGNIDATYSFSNLVEDGKYGPVELSLVAMPIYPVYNEDGSYGNSFNSNIYNANADPSPLETAIGYDWNEKQFRTFAKLYSEFKITPNLVYNISLGGVINNNREFKYRPSWMSTDSTPAPTQAYGNARANYSVNWLIENTMTYDKIIREIHHVNALLGYTVQKNDYEDSYIHAINYPNDVIHTLNAGQVTDGYTTISKHSLISYIARLNYSYKDKYFFTGTARRDGSSRFGINRKWGVFPSGSFGWRISEEEFMKKLSFISNLKLRLSYGHTGNYSIPNYGSIGLLDNGYYVFGDGNGATVNAVSPSTMSNPDLSWEKTQQFNLGMDLGLFKNRIYLEADYYHSTTKDLLLNVPVPRITGYGKQLQNIGKVRNRGLELMVSSRNTIHSFKWSTDFNISFNRNIVLALGPDNRPIYASAPNASNAFVTEVGKPMSNMYGYIFDGVYMTQEEIDNHAHLPSDVIGDPIIRDVNLDGIISSDDRTVIGNNQPDFIGGLTNNFSYKGFDLKILLTGLYGNEVFRLSSRFTKFYHGDRNSQTDVINRWRSPEQPGDGKIFRANTLYRGLQKEPSSYWIEDGSYLRIKEFNLGYNINSERLSGFGIKEARLFFTISNLYTFTNYWGFDPEVSTQGTGLTKGGDYSGYPVPRTFLLGFNINF